MTISMIMILFLQLITYSDKDDGLFLPLIVLSGYWIQAKYLTVFGIRYEAVDIIDKHIFHQVRKILTLSDIV
jgi:hypothetical protein